ncbi:GNAT family N-acetyltransferase [Ruegeria sp. ANG-R]|uniref:GNAT family N-acetyltransferase n=1 Tax=Ruegeria sp. ANG-R TaxID=1577903 RepID=UPI001F4D159E|nr:GNAT family N-acetyltransferase [Ruegeria sp. ANG-R]
MFDVFGMSCVLIRSITLLCEADHGNNPKKLAEWTANKDPASIRQWIASGAELWVGATGDEVSAVGGVRAAGEISLLYVDPDRSGQGLGSALLTRMEASLRAQGCSLARLHATETAFEFYLAQGWRADGEQTEWNGIPQFPMRKSLHPAA